MDHAHPRDHRLPGGGGPPGIVLAMLNAIGQLLNLPAFPLWSIIIIAIDVMIIYGLTVYGTMRATT
jgi:hypothetical protein